MVYLEAQKGSGLRVQGLGFREGLGRVQGFGWVYGLGTRTLGLLVSSRSFWFQAFAWFLVQVLSFRALDVSSFRLRDVTKPSTLNIQLGP